VDYDLPGYGGRKLARVTITSSRSGIFLIMLLILCIPRSGTLPGVSRSGRFPPGGISLNTILL
jgi:hypothetical protein